MAGHRKEKTGIVVSDSMDKTITIKSQDLVVHPTLGKVVKRIKKYMAHDEKNESKIGDKVLIKETRPMSKKKCWVLVSILEKANKGE